MSKTATTGSNALIRNAPGASTIAPGPRQLSLVELDAPSGGLPGFRPPAHEAVRLLLWNQAEAQASLERAEQRGRALAERRRERAASRSIRERVNSPYD